MTDARKATSSNPYVLSSELGRPLTRRTFLRLGSSFATAAALSGTVRALGDGFNATVRIGMIADLHQDVMHDGEARMDSFLEWAASTKVDRVIQLGDFAYPSSKNKAVIDKFNKAKGLHVIGNHDLDSGHTKKQCIDYWGMPGRYYSHGVGGIRLLVLDGNDKGSPTHKGGYPSYVGKEQVAWLEDQLQTFGGPFIIFSHQALHGHLAIDNAQEIHALLCKYAEKIAICVNGHSHIDLLQRVDGIHYFHVNSASYQWVGGKHKHESYSTEIHAAHPWISYTSPYRDPVFAGLAFDLNSGLLSIEGRESAWVGPSPAELGADLNPNLIHGEEIAPRIRSRRIQRLRSLN
ncbi:MAG: alkaline phosphatase [Planctomycetota bacterium]|nr:MAG: alkaline phosphatase [Planctomycetota bacterium]